MIKEHASLIRHCFLAGVILAVLIYPIVRFWP